MKALIGELFTLSFVIHKAGCVCFSSFLFVLLFFFLRLWARVAGPSWVWEETYQGQKALLSQSLIKGLHVEKSQWPREILDPPLRLAGSPRQTQRQVDVHNNYPHSIIIKITWLVSSGCGLLNDKDFTHGLFSASKGELRRNDKIIRLGKTGIFFAAVLSLLVMKLGKLWNSESGSIF